MKIKHFIFFIVIVSFLFISAHNEDVWDSSINKVSTIYSVIEENYFKDIDKDQAIYSSIRGMLRTLDPHSYFLDPKSFLRLKEDYKAKYYGLGILIQKQEDRLVVISPLEGTPAYRLGIQAGDIISHINGESTKPISSLEAVEKLRGPKGKPVNITIVREGLREPLELTVVRDEIPLYSVPYAFMIGDETGYILIRNFAKTTTDEFEEKMKSLVKQGMTRLILDMRSNTGGTFFQSMEITDEFLPKGDLMVSIKGRKNYYNKEFHALRNNQYEEIPLVILINQGTASAPEIVAGAIKDNDRGIIIGQNSWGKGLVQTVFPLSSNTAVALTIAKYYTPSGRMIQKYSSIDDYILGQAVPQTQRNVRYTSEGRKVLGQGGISPDYEVEFQYKNITAKLLLKGLFFSYSRRFADHKTPLSKKYIFAGKDSTESEDTQGKILMEENFVVDDKVIDDFHSFLISENIEFDEDKFKDAKKEIKRELEREIFSSLWGIEEGIKIFRKSDPVVLKAFEVFPEAERLLEENQQ